MRFRALSIADLPAIQMLHATGERQGVLADWLPEQLGLHLYPALATVGAPLVAVVGVLGARIQGGRFTGGRPKGLALGWRVPSGLGTGVACQVELILTSAAHLTWRGRPMAALLLRALAETAGVPLLGLSPPLPALPLADDAGAQLSPRPAHRPRDHRAVVCGDGRGIGPHLPAPH